MVAAEALVCVGDRGIAVGGGGGGGGGGEDEDRVDGKGNG